ncbi:receptor-type tyrosine-protein phosphatase delta-like [Watersipora subatra]|uniref:receptor-type tyrosine-protein phosphatase delta-like n=1 Tax=Watersipora subatra TaxID=2589382 RepID=UPI00355BCBEB
MCSRPNEGGGGVCVYVADGFEARVLAATLAGAEAVFASVHSSGRRIFSVLAVYRAPSGALPSFLEDLGALIPTLPPDTIIVGPQLSPVSFNMRVDSPKCVTLSWEPPNWPNGPITGYQYKCNDESSWTDIVDSADKREYQLCHFSPYQVVECELRAVNSAGNSNSSTAPSVTTDCDVSTAPGNLKFSDPKEENNEGRLRLKYTVTWKKPDVINCAEIKSYIITYPKSMSEPESVQNSVFNRVVYADGEEEITFSVYAVNNADFESVVRSVIITSKPLRPQIAPTDVSIQADNSSCVTVSWEPPLWPNGKITGYQYKRNTETGTQWTNIGDVRSLQICQYSPHESVQCEIRARNSAGKSDTATTDEIRTDCTASSVPQDVTFGQPNIVQRSGRDRLMYTVKWQEPQYINCENITSYNTKYSAFDFNVTSISVKSRDVYADGNRPVEFHVTAVNNDNLESAAVFISITTPEIRPQLYPRSVYTAVTSSRCVTISWQPPQWPNGPITRYQYKCNDKGSWTNIVESADKREYQLCHFSPYMEVECELRAVNSAGSSNPATAPAVTTDCDAPVLPIELLKYVTESIYKPKDSHYHRRRILMHIPKNDITANCRDITLRQYKLQGSVNYTLDNQSIDDLNAVTNYTIVYSARNDEGFNITGSLVATTGELEPGPVEVVMNPFNLSCVSLSWTNPQPPNGVITGYQYRCNVFNSTIPNYTAITVAEELALCDYQPGDLVICEVRASTDVGYGPSANSETSVYCGVPGKAVVQETQIVVYNNKEMRELINMNFTWKPVVPNCRGIANYSISLFYHNQLLKTQINEAGKRDFSVESLYPYTNYTLLISTTNDEGFSSDFSYPIYTQETAPTDSPYLTLEFSSSCVELTIASPRLPNGRILRYTYGCQDSKSQLKNPTYFTLDASNITRDSFPKVCGFLPALRVNCSVYASNTAGDSPTANVIGYTQLQLADASITRTDHLVAFSTVSKGFSHTSILLKPVDLINVLRNESYYQIIVQAPGKLNSKRKKRYALFENSTCDSDSLYGYETAAELGMTCYITAEIPGSSVTDDGLTVNIGDGQTLNNYYNAPLEPETNYTLAVGLVVYPEEGQSIMYYMEPVQFHSYREIEITAAEPPTQLNIGIGVGVSLAVLITTGVVIFFLYQRRKPPPDDPETDDVSLSHLDPPRARESRPPVPEKPVGLPSRPRPAPPTPAFPTTQPISLSHLTDYITDKEAIFSEYNDVLKKMPKPTMNVALLPENRGKCKYIGLYPEDEHRVILDRTDDEGTDFINASFLEGYEKGELFIASQGPLETTIDDFWLMIFQQRPKAIVMVTNTVEMGKHKCEQYWPEDVGGVMKFRDIKVTLTTCDIWADYVVRSLSVTKGGETFKTKQFHFTSWPDHGVPAEMSPYVTFYKKVKEGTQHLTRPMLVHCSAGVGRTGTFISCWNLLKEAKKTQAVDVLGCVTAMRLRRPCMVQVKEQYYFLHCVVDEILKTETFSCAPLGTEAKLNFYYEQNGGANDAITAEFKRIEMRLAAMGQRTFSGLEDDNRDKNRSMQVLPDKSHCVYINSGDYINAVLLDGYRFTKQIVCTQLPLANTVADFWKMVEEQEIKIVVQLEQGDTQFYPTDDGEVLVCTNYTIHRLAMETNEHLSFISLAVTCTLSNQTRTVSLLLTKEWNKRGDINELPNRVALLHHLEALEKLLRQNGDGKFCVADKLGTTRCGLIVTAYNALAKLKTEQEVDLYNTVLMARCRRRQFISTIEEYTFLYDLLKHYTDSFSDYANFK